MTLRPFVLLMPLLLMGCSTLPSPGAWFETPGPQLISEGRRDASGRELFRWDRPGAFGGMSRAQKIQGDVACMTTSIELEATGYHARARDARGQVLPEGGYLCTRKANGEQPDTTPPRLVRNEGVLGWDRPTAFGKVPQQAQARGNLICQGRSPNMLAVGYHPGAQLENGQTIPEGGFFCAPKASR